MQYVHFRLHTLQTFFFYLGGFLRKSDNQYSSITKGSIYHVSDIFIGWTSGKLSSFSPLWHVYQCAAVCPFKTTHMRLLHFRWFYSLGDIICVSPTKRMSIQPFTVGVDWPDIGCWWWKYVIYYVWYFVDTVFYFIRQTLAKIPV